MISVTADYILNKLSIAGLAIFVWILVDTVLDLRKRVAQLEQARGNDLVRLVAAENRLAAWIVARASLQ